MGEPAYNLRAGRPRSQVRVRANHLTLVTGLNDTCVNMGGDTMTGSLTFYNGTINTASISAAGTATFSGDVGVGGDLGVGGTLSMNLGQKFYFDSAGIGHNDFIYQPSTDSDTIAIYTSESLAMVFNESRVVVGTQRDFVVQQGKSFYLDGGGNDYLKIDLANNITTFIDGVDMLRVTSAGIAVNPGKVINLDGGGNDYIYQSASDTVSIHAGEFNVATFDGNGNGKFSTQVQVFMPGVRGQAVAGNNQVFIDTNTGQLGTVPNNSSIDVKENITDLDIDTSEIYDLRAISFDYINGGEHSFGYLAEEVAKIFPDLVFFNDEEQPVGIRYDKLSVLLLEELKKIKTQQDQSAELIQTLVEEIEDLKRIVLNKNKEQKGENYVQE